jgi:hypothetical protein
MKAGISAGGARRLAERPDLWTHGFSAKTMTEQPEKDDNRHEKIPEIGFGSGGDRERDPGFRHAGVRAWRCC